MTTENNLAVVDWESHKPPTDLIFDDGEPLESNRHRIAMNILIRSLQQAWADRNDYFTGGNMFIYYSSTQVRNRDFRGPDFFAVLNVDGNNSRLGWVVWEENGRYPDVIVELMSPSTAAIDKGIKKNLYEQTFHTSDYFVYDPNPCRDVRRGTSLRMTLEMSIIKTLRFLASKCLLWSDRTH
jgi:Uma2 family endonuclease